MKTFFIDSNLAQYTDEELAFLMTNYMSEGVLDYGNANTDMKVTQYSGGANMSVDVQIGACVIEITKNGKTFKTANYSNSVVNKQIASNSSGVTRYDTVIARVDVENELNELKNNVFTIEVVQGNLGSILTDNDITAYVNSDGWYRLADVTVNNGATSITNALITDRRTASYFGANKSSNYKVPFLGDGINLENVANKYDKNDLKGRFFDFYDKCFYGNFQTIASFESDESWSGGSANAVNFRAGVQGRKISPAGAGEVTSSLTFTTAKNLSVFLDNSVSYDEDYITIAIYADSVANLSACGLRLKTNSGSYYQYDFGASGIVVGWNYKKIAKKDFAVIGAPSWANITIMTVFATTSSGTINITFDTCQLVRGSGVTSRFYDRTSNINNNTTTSGSILTLGSVDSITRLQSKDYTGYYLKINNLITDGKGKIFTILSNTANTITVSGTLPTLSANVEWEIWRPDFAEDYGTWAIVNENGIEQYGNIKDNIGTTAQAGYNVTTETYKNVSFVAKMTQKSSLSQNMMGYLWSYQDSQNFYYVVLTNSTLEVRRMLANVETTLINKTITLGADSAVYVKIVKEDNRIEAYYSYDGQTYSFAGSVVDNTLPATGKLGLLSYGTNANCRFGYIGYSKDNYADVARKAMALDPNAVAPDISKLITNFTAGETITAGKVVALAGYGSNDTGLALTTYNTDVSCDKAMIRFKPSADGSYDYLKLKLKVSGGTPSGPLRVMVYAGNNSKPTWTSLLAVTPEIHYSKLTGTSAEYTLPLSEKVAMTTSNYYWIVFSDRLDATASSYYSFGVATSDTDASAQYYTGIIGDTSNPTLVSANDPYLVVGYYTDDNRLFHADSVKRELSARTVGVAVNGGAIGDSIRVVRRGKATVASAVVVDTDYFLDTAGGITATDPSVDWSTGSQHKTRVYLGKAVSTTEIYIDMVISICLEAGWLPMQYATHVLNDVHIDWGVFTGGRHQTAKNRGNWRQNAGYQRYFIGGMEGIDDWCFTMITPSSGNDYMYNSGSFCYGSDNAGSTEAYYLDYKSLTKRGIIFDLWNGTTGTASSADGVYLTSCIFELKK